MTHPASASLARQLGALFEGGSAAGLSDHQLLERFLARSDPAGEAAFAAIAARHGPMVLGVCRQILGDHHLAEDAFQATFFVLARRARAIRDPELLGAWLYGVALRTARKARGRLARRRQTEQAGAAGRPEARPAVQAEQMIDREQAEALHREIDRLPESFRLAVVSCYFEGLAPDEAARRLRWSSGTLRSRLVRAREKLRRGLTRRGVVLPGAALAAVLDAKPASASVSSLLCDSTTKAAIHFAAREAVAPLAAALAQEVLRSMLIHKLKSFLLTFLFLGAVASGAGYLTQSLAMKDEPKRPSAGQQTPVAAKPDDANPTPAPGRMFVVGRVLDPQGQPVPNATVMVSMRLKRSERPILIAFEGPLVISHTRADGSGRFRIDAPRTSSSQHDGLRVTALAPGYGIGWVELDPDADQPAADVALRPEQVIHGRLFDVQGRPARGVALKVRSILRAVHGEIEGPNFAWDPDQELPAWPEPATTDADGRFTLRGLGRGLRVLLVVDDPRFASQDILIETAGGVDASKLGILEPAIKVDASSDAKPLTMALPPAQIITGRVTYADTGQPVPHAPLAVSSVTRGRGGSSRPTDFQVDGEGRFRANPAPGDRFILTAQSPNGPPYLAVRRILDWPKGAVEQLVNLSLPRGAVIAGKITEEGSGKPVEGAVVRFTPYGLSNRDSDGMSAPSTTKSDGSFQVAAPPSRGYLVIQGPSNDYVLRVMGAQGGVYYAQPGSRRFYAHAYASLDLKSDQSSQEVNLSLRPGMTVKGRVVGPDGRPVQDAFFFSRVILTAEPSGGWKSWKVIYGRGRGQVRAGRFEIHGLDPDAEVPVFFFDPEHQLGATAHLSGKSTAGGPVTIRLEPCGTAKARLVDRGGKPVAGGRPAPSSITMIVSPGLPYSGRPDKEGRLFADEGHLRRIDPIHYPKSPVSDAQGRMVLPALIPGATYRIVDDTTFNETGPQVRREFTVRPGETLDLGDILIEKPPS